MNYRKYVVDKAKEKNKNANLWINLGPRNSAGVQGLIAKLGTSSNKEIAQIIIGLFNDPNVEIVQKKAK